MKTARCLPVLVMVGLLAGAGADRVTSGSVGGLGIADEVKDVVEAEEVWRAGGPREDRMLEWYKQATEADQPDAGQGLGELMVELFHRRWLDPTPFAKYDEGFSGTLSVGWQQELALWRMPAAERHRVYLDVLRAGKPNYELGLSWNGAAYYALLEHMDDLIPEIEATMERSPHANYRAAETKVPRPHLLELAHARSGDWKANYLRLIREKLEAQAKAGEGHSDFVGNEIIRDALLELVHSGDTTLLAPLKELWRGIKPPVEMEKPENRRIWEWFVKQGQKDPEYSRDGLAAAYLVRAIQALGDPSFQEKNTNGRKNREYLKKFFIDHGYLRRATEVK